MRSGHIAPVTGQTGPCASGRSGNRDSGICHLGWRSGLSHRLGGVGGSEGSVHLSLEGDEERVNKAFELVKSIKGEPPVSLPDTFFVSSAADYNYDALAQLATLKGV